MRTNQIPPVWAIEAGDEIADVKNTSTSGISSIISKYAPDAEALAVALEKVDAAFKSYEIMFPAQYAYLVNSEIPNVLRQYRARFPKARENAR